MKKMNKLIKVSIGSWNGDVVVSDNLQDRCSGLSGINKLKKNSGMLFKFNVEEVPTITTMDMKFDIDVICFNNQFIVNDAVYNISPGRIVPLRKPLLYFLEINSGEGEDIEIGDKLIIF